MTGTGWVLGLTGGIASGKSTVCLAFAQLGLSIVDTDLLAREVVQPGQPAWQGLVDHFGAEVLLADQQLNRPWLRQRIFDQPELRKLVEQQIHPRVRSLSWQRLADAQQQSPYAILVSPLLFESQEHRKCQRTLLITLQPAEQLRRLCQRDGCSPAEGQKIIDAQMPQADKIALADDILDNSQTNDGQMGSASLAASDSLTARVQALHEQYLRLASAWRG